MHYMGWAKLAPFSISTAKKVAMLSFIFIIYVVISLIALSRVNVPMFTALRRLTVVFVMVRPTPPGWRHPSQYLSPVFTRSH